MKCVTLACIAIMLASFALLVPACRDDKEQQIIKLNARISELESQIKTRDDTIRSQKEEIDALKRKLSQLAGATSDAARALEDFYFAFRPPVSETDFDSQAAPIMAKLKKIESAISRDTRAHQLIAKALTSINNYAGRVQLHYLSKAGHTMDKSIEALVAASRGEGSSSAEYDHRIEKEDAVLAREASDFRQEIQTSITLLKEQVAIMREGI